MTNFATVDVSAALEELWQELCEGSLSAAHRNTFRIDPQFYLDENPDVAQAGVAPDEHYSTYGQREGRPPNLYHRLAQVIPDLDDRIRAFAAEPRLIDLMDRGEQDAFELAFELVGLGAPIDARVSNFSRGHYLANYPDIRASGVNPLRHYIQFGITEGRENLVAVRRACHKGGKAYDPSKPTCIISVHQLSKTGAPMVGLELIRQASETSNVIAVSLSGGPLFEPVLEASCYTVVSYAPEHALAYIPGLPINSIDFAIINSAEGYPLVPFLVAKEIPFGVYIHEYADYTLPRVRRTLSLFADKLIFSSNVVRDTWSNVFADVGVDAERETMVVPQATLTFKSIDRSRYEEARRRVSTMLGRDVTNQRIVFGAALAHWRKGTGLFLQAYQAMEQIDPNCLFIWVGDGVNHEDINFGAWIERHARRLGVNDSTLSNLVMLPSGEHYWDICDAGDVLFLSSRLDPLPNVVFDAASRGCQTVLFRGATGFDDDLYRQSDCLHFADYCDVPGAVKAITSTPLKASTANHIVDVGEGDRSDGSAIAEVGNVDHTLFDALADQIRSHVDLVDSEPREDGSFDVSILFGDDVDEAESRRRERHKVWARGKRFYWKSVDEINESLARSDDWVSPHCSAVELAADNGSAPSVVDYGVHLHIPKLARLPGRIDVLKDAVSIAGAKRLVVTTSKTEVASAASEAFPSAEVLVLNGGGKAVGALLELQRSGVLADADWWCQLHTGDLYSELVPPGHDAASWRTYLYSHIVGDADTPSPTAPLVGDPGVGVVAALDPFIWGWGQSRRWLDTANSWFDQPLAFEHLPFPQENMLWVRPAVVETLAERLGSNYLWPNEPIANNGTIYRTIERCWPAFAASTGLRSVFGYMPGSSR